MNPVLLTQEELNAALCSLPDWSLDAGELTRTFRFATYLDGAAFVTRVAERADAMDHHPELHLGWRKVILRVHTHSAGGITALDIALAELADLLHESKVSRHA
jgi:4a-hydroxytetrahydrobiopterin dehydratase